jgi:hypothetical protein
VASAKSPPQAGHFIQFILLPIADFCRAHPLDPVRLFIALSVAVVAATLLRARRASGYARTLKSPDSAVFMCVGVGLSGSQNADASRWRAVTHGMIAAPLNGSLTW